jgi:hypothetical protein
MFVLFELDLNRPVGEPLDRNHIIMSFYAD